MISKVFFINSIDYNNQEIYEEFYLNYLIAEILSDSDKKLIKDLITILKKTYGTKTINKSQLYCHLKKHFNSISKYVWMDNEQKCLFYQVREAKKLFNKFLLTSEVEIAYNLSDYVSQSFVDIRRGILLSLALDKNHDVKFYMAKYYDLLLNYEKYSLQLDLAINNIEDNYNKLPLKFLISDKKALEVFLMNDINTLEDLRLLSVDSLMVIFANHFGQTLEILEALKKNFKKTFKRSIYEIFGKLKDIEKDVLDKRYGFSSDKYLTLQEIGDEYSFTRERCRQIESSGIAKLIMMASRIRQQLINIFYVISDFKEGYIAEDALYEYLCDSLVTKYSLFLLTIMDLTIRYDRELKVIYDINMISKDDILILETTKYKNVIFIDEYEYFSSLQKAVINHGYKRFNEKVYIKNGIYLKDLIVEIINDNFKEGFKINNDEYLRKFYQCFYEKYKDALKLPSGRSIIGVLERSNYCQIDKGKYKNKEYCAILPEDLVLDIIQYVVFKQPVIYYISIFEEFRDKLISFGVDNYYYLKGLIDEHLPSTFKTNRSCIYASTEIVTNYEYLILFFKSFGGMFSIDDLRARFTGVKDYTFLNVLTKESEKGLIFLSNRRYIYFQNLKITNILVYELKKCIDETFEELNVNIISAKKVYSSLLRRNTHTLKDIAIIDDSYSLFSLIKFLFKDEYAFSRPLISLDKNANISAYSLIANHISRLRSFNFHTIKEYTERMNIRGLYSYLEFMEDNSDEFVQINVDTMIKKEKFLLNSVQMTEIKIVLERLFNFLKSINTKYFKVFDIFPKISYQWNKYLLVGIIRSYFNNCYNIKNIGNTYDNVDFLITKN